jgi:hypothetical protein
VIAKTFPQKHFSLMISERNDLPRTGTRATNTRQWKASDRLPSLLLTLSASSDPTPTSMALGSQADMPNLIV